MEERWVFDYDDQGRLARVVDKATETETVYEYDPDQSAVPSNPCPEEAP